MKEGKCATRQSGRGSVRLLPLPVGAAASQTAADVYSRRGRVSGGGVVVVWRCGGDGGLLSCLRSGRIDCTSLSCGGLRREAAYLRRLDLYGDIYGASEQLFGFCFLFLAGRLQPVGYENCFAGAFKGLMDDMVVYLMRILRCCTALKYLVDILSCFHLRLNGKILVEFTHCGQEDSSE